jgi:hypothetical protein
VLKKGVSSWLQTPRYLMSSINISHPKPKNAIQSHNLRSLFWASKHDVCGGLMLQGVLMSRTA